MSYVEVNNCTSSAPITLNRTFLDGSPYTSYSAGIVGLQNANFDVKDCTNQGNLDITLTNNSKVSYTAGIVAYTKGDEISGCTNNGAISFNGGEMTKQNYVAGVCGWNNIVTLFKDLTNNGDITVSNWTNTAYNYIGGISAQYSGSGHTYKNLHNTGNITSTATSKMRLGGIGGAINTNKLVLEDCSNTGNIYMKDGQDDSTIGGLTGYWGGGDINNASSDCTVTAVNSGVSIVGGFIGAENVTMTWKDVVVSGSVVANAECKAGHLLGRFHSASKKITLAGTNSFTATVNGAAPDAVPATSGNAVGNWNSGSFVAE